MPPLNVVGGDLFAEVPLPRDATVACQRRKLPRTEPRVDERSIRDGTRAREIVLVVNGGERAFRFDSPFPQALSPVSASRVLEAKSPV